jgi:hypothetical protein
MAQAHNRLERVWRDVVVGCEGVGVFFREVVSKIDLPNSVVLCDVLLISAPPVASANKKTSLNACPNPLGCRIRHPSLDTLSIRNLQDVSRVYAVDNFPAGGVDE